MTNPVPLEEAMPAGVIPVRILELCAAVPKKPKHGPQIPVPEDPPKEARWLQPGISGQLQDQTLTPGRSTGKLPGSL